MRQCWRWWKVCSLESALLHCCTVAEIVNYIAQARQFFFFLHKQVLKQNKTLEHNNNSKLLKSTKIKNVIKRHLHRYLFIQFRCYGMHNLASEFGLQRNKSSLLTSQQRQEHWATGKSISEMQSHADWLAS